VPQTGVWDGQHAVDFGSFSQVAQRARDGCLLCSIPVRKGIHRKPSNLYDDPTPEQRPDDRVVLCRHWDECLRFGICGFGPYNWGFENGVQDAWRQRPFEGNIMSAYLDVNIDPWYDIGRDSLGPYWRANPWIHPVDHKRSHLRAVPPRINFAMLQDWMTLCINHHHCKLEVSTDWTMLNDAN
jgi:hypothetical protein